jgi:hypothetical protein
MLADVGFRLDDDPTCDSVSRLALEYRAKQLARDNLGVAIVEIASKNPTQLIPALRLLPRQLFSGRHA